MASAVIPALWHNAIVLFPFMKSMIYIEETFHGSALLHKNAKRNVLIVEAAA